MKTLWLVDFYLSMHNKVRKLGKGGTVEVYMPGCDETTPLTKFCDTLPSLGWLTQDLAQIWKANSPETVKVHRMAIFATNNIYPDGALAGDIFDNETYELGSASH